MRINLKKAGAPRIAQVWYAKKTTVEGHVFDSISEGARYAELRWLEHAGKIKNLKPHPVLFKFYEGDVLITQYLPDFMYTVPGETRPVVEDYKGGTITPEYDIKRKWFRAKYGDKFRFLETGPSAGKKPGKVRKKRLFRRKKG